MIEAERRLYAPNLICVCVNTTEAGDYAGLIWNQYSDRPDVFHNSIEMIHRMEALYDAWNFPQRSTGRRTFKITKENSPGMGQEGAVQLMDARRVQEKKGDKGTFIVRVKYRQNATWQGEVIWTEQKQKRCFRSALELLKLIDSALDAEDETEALRKLNGGNEEMPLGIEREDDRGETDV